MRKSRKMRGGVITAQALEDAANSATTLASQLTKIATMVAAANVVPDSGDLSVPAATASPIAAGSSVPASVTATTASPIGSGDGLAADASKTSAAAAAAAAAAATAASVSPPPAPPPPDKVYAPKFYVPKKILTSAPGSDAAAVPGSSAAVDAFGAVTADNVASAPSSKSAVSSDISRAKSAPAFVPVSAPSAASASASEPAASSGSAAGFTSAVPDSAAGSGAIVPAPVSTPYYNATNKKLLIDGQTVVNSNTIVKVLNYTIANTANADTKQVLENIIKEINSAKTGEDVGKILAKYKIKYNVVTGQYTYTMPAAMSGGTKKRKMPNRRKTRKTRKMKKTRKTRKMKRMLRKMMRKTMKI